MNIHSTVCESQKIAHDEIAALRVINLKKNFGPVEVLKGISLSVGQGEVVSILGGSGSGKSTFLRCLNFLEEPSAGEIWVAGQRVSDERGSVGARKVNALRMTLGMVFQSFNLWPHKTVFDNVVEAPIHVLGLSKQDAGRRALARLEEVGMADHRHAYPAHLSGGQQQRVAIARALAMEPKILLFDEPTSALDPERVGEVLKVIRALSETGRTMLVVTHELGFARQVSDRVAFFHAGQVEELGKPDHFFSNPASPRLRQFLSANAREFDR